MIKIDRLAQTNNERDKCCVLRRYKLRVCAVCCIIVFLVIVYVIIEVNYCKTHEDGGNQPYMWTGSYYSISYFFTLVVMLVGWSYEYAVMKRFK